jgi:hypothetical protein
MDTVEEVKKEEKDIRCPYTKSAKLLNGLVAPILSMRNRPNQKDIKFKYGKRAGQLKPCKHKDCNEDS